MKTDYTPPKFKAERFNCPHCHAFSAHEWSNLYATPEAFPVLGYETVGRVEAPHVERRKRDFATDCNHHGRVPPDISVCQSCYDFALWISETGEMVFPRIVTAPLPSSDMPKETCKVYEEARNIADVSPRAAAALLRLALEKLMEESEVRGKTLNQQIAYLVEQGILSDVQKALDAVRVAGTDQIHDLGEIHLVLDDGEDTANTLFDLVNFAVEQMITKPQKVRRMYDRLPELKRKAIEERDDPQ